MVLTGMLVERSAGLRAIINCGGTAVVQDPADAQLPSMPKGALARVEADHMLPLAAPWPLLQDLAGRPAFDAAPTVPPPL